MPTLKPLPIKIKNTWLIFKVYSWLTSIRQWEIMEDWLFMLPNGETIVIPKGFIFDGASIPRPFWFLLPPTGLLLIPGLIHDFAYRYNYLWLVNEKDGQKFYSKYEVNSGQKYWDMLFRQISVNVNGMVYIDQFAWYSLSVFGRTAWKRNRQLNSLALYPGGDDLLRQIKLNPVQKIVKPVIFA